jgi:hypothetical protein
VEQLEERNLLSISISPPLTYAVGTTPIAVIVGDFRGDGKLDLAVANQGSNSVSVLLGNGDGTFATAQNYPVGSQPSALALGDFNGDDKPDLVVTNSDSTISVLLGKGDGTFRPSLTSPGVASPVSVAVGDFRGNGKQDLAVSQSLSSFQTAVSVLLGNGDGTFAAPITTPLNGNVTVAGNLVVGEFSGNGKADVAAVKFIPSSGFLSDQAEVAVLLGKGDGTFQPEADYATGTATSAVAAGDFTGRGKVDLALVGGGFRTTHTPQPLSVGVLPGNGDGTFGVPINPPVFAGFFGALAVAVADLTNDGKLDIVTNHNQVEVALGNGNGTFQASQMLPTGFARAVAVGDFNGDGKGDFVTTDSGNNTVSVFLTAASSATALTASANATVFGQPVTFTATVTGVPPSTGMPTGAVTFQEGPTVLATVPLDAGDRASFTTAGLPGNQTHMLVASYSGDPHFATSASAPVSVAVTPSDTTVVVTGSPNPSPFGQPVTFTADVRAVAPSTATPADQVTFTDGPTTLATVSLTNGHATYTSPTALTIGTHTITATYKSSDSSSFHDSMMMLTQTVQASGATPATPSQQFVAAIYRDLLGRPVDASGLATWSVLLDLSGDRAMVVAAIENTAEYKTDEVEQLYHQYLHRPADPAGLSTGVALLATGGTVEQLAAVLAGSPEYFQSRGGGTNSGFLNALYNDVLGRPADPTGSADATALLAAGVSRSAIAGGILYSAEAIEDRVQSYYQQFLRRPADPFGLNSYVTLLQAGVPDELVQALILGSAEYKNRFVP